jgi:hypothetical protein
MAAALHSMLAIATQKKRQLLQRLVLIRSLK